MPDRIAKLNIEIPGLEEIVRRALMEDIGTGDVTTMLTVGAETTLEAVVVAREGGIVAGLAALTEVFRQVDSRLTVAPLLVDGDRVEAGAHICRVSGPARSILTGERVALNLLQRMSGIASMTARFVARVEGTRARIVDTRKTMPGLRILEKYAVRVGGGFNHRFGLYDSILIKDNHIGAAGGITEAVQKALAGASHTLTITVECDSLEQVDEALAAGADALLLDNMPPDVLSDAVTRVDGQVTLEASGGITEETVADVAASGVDILSVGALTHSAAALDIGLDIVGASYL